MYPLITAITGAILFLAREEAAEIIARIMSRFRK
jgi:chemotaxis protein CheY-P-specific phosphatase CheC